MNEANQLSLVMFVLACAAVALVSGQFYIEHSAMKASAIETPRMEAQQKGKLALQVDRRK